MAHLTIAASEAVFDKTLAVVVANFAFEAADEGDFGAFSAGYDVRLVLENGRVDLRDDGTIRLAELDGRWEKLEFSLGLDIPGFCLGGGCFEPPFGLPEICLPQVCVFGDDPDINLTIDLAPFVRHELTVVGRPLVTYFDPATTTIGPLCQRLHDLLGIDDTRTEWRISIDPQTIDFDPFDFADTAGALFEERLTDAITALLPAGPLRDLILAAIGTVADLIRTLLRVEIEDDIHEWLSDLFNVSFGLGNIVLTFVADFFGKCVSFYQIEDPFPILPERSTETGTLIPVCVPIRDLTATVNDDELIITADIGA